MADYPLHRCSWCLDAINFKRSGTQAVTLPCGHSFCRQCLISAKLKRCYVCHEPFIGSATTMAFDYYLRDTMGAPSDVPDPLTDVLERLGVEGGVIKMLPPDTLDVGEEISSDGKSGVLHRGTLLGVQVAIKAIKLFRDNPWPPTSWSQIMESMVGHPPKHSNKSLIEKILLLLGSMTKCPHVARYLGVARKGIYFCVVMELYPQNLAAHISNQPGQTLCLTEALHLGMYIARALCNLHSRGIRASNMKAENVLIDKQGCAVLADFDITQFVENTVGHRCTGWFNCNNKFKAPEEIGGSAFRNQIIARTPKTCKTDLWAFACLMINMLTGYPFSRELDPMFMRTQVTFSQIKRALPKGTPKRLLSVLQSCLKFHPKDRPTAAVVLESLREIFIKLKENANKLEAKQKGVPQPHQRVQAVAVFQHVKQIAAALHSSKLIQGWIKGASAVPQLVLISSNKLEDAMEQMRLYNSPAIYDFQGQEMRFREEESSMTLPGGVTWRNGTVMLTGQNGARGQGLVVMGTGVTLASMLLIGGLEGVRVASGGSLTMVDCKILDCCCGVRLGGNASLVASNLKILNCSDSSLSLHGGSTADVLGCEVRGSHRGIYMNENSSFVGTRMCITEVPGHGVSMHDGARLSFTDSSMMGSDGKLGVVKDKALVALFHCSVDGKFETDEHATVQIKN